MNKAGEAGLLRRFAGAILDALLFLALTLLLFGVFQWIFTSTSWYAGRNEMNREYRLSSGLYAGEGDELIDSDGFMDYQEALLRFYGEGLPSLTEGEEPDRKGRSLAYWYNVNILGLEDLDNAYGYVELLSPAKEAGKDLFQWAKDEEGNLLKDEVAIPADSLFLSGSAYREDGGRTPLSDLTEEGRLSLLEFHYDETGAERSLYYNALEKFEGTEPYKSSLVEEKAIRRAYPLFVGALASYPLVYLLMPLVLKEGATLGKKVFALGLANSLGYRVGKGQLVLRALPQYSLAAILLLFVPQAVALALIFGLILVSYLLSIFTRGHKAVHDYIAATAVVDLRGGAIFQDRAEEERALAAIEEARARGEELLRQGEKALEEERKEEG